MLPQWTLSLTQPRTFHRAWILGWRGLWGRVRAGTLVEEREFQKKDRYRQGSGTKIKLHFKSSQEPARPLPSPSCQLNLTHSQQNSTNDRLSSDERGIFLRSLLRKEKEMAFRYPCFVLSVKKGTWLNGGKKSVDRCHLCNHAPSLLSALGGEKEV